MKLYWSPRSPFVRKVAAVAIDAGLDDSIECVRTVADSQAPNLALMDKNPWAKIPTFETDEGVVLYDSDVICDYLEELSGDALARRRAGVERWKMLAWRACANEMLDALVLWRHERQRQAAFQSARLMAAFELKVRRALDWLEQRGGSLGTLDFRVAQVPLACAMGYLDFRYRDYDWRAGRPALARWEADVAARPALVRTAPIDDLAQPATAAMENSICLGRYRT